jgi:hypothetical protein
MKPGVAFWASVVVVVGLAYPISFGPACWITSRLNAGAGCLPTVYRPFIWALSPDDTDSRLNAALFWYAELAAAPYWGWYPAPNRNGEMVEWEWDVGGTSF